MECQRRRRHGECRGLAPRAARAGLATVPPWRRTSAQSKLRVLGHRIALVQDDQLELVAARRPSTGDAGQASASRPSS